ncbi:MAG: GNAT family N-acetyltransferase [Candidatus Taylorbacteria bacterium]|nr:GNAT family N-acetyltransferase [Candidatus Taylorbacteria bacterium]
MNTGTQVFPIVGSDGVSATSPYGADAHLASLARVYCAVHHGVEGVKWTYDTALALLTHLLHRNSVLSFAALEKQRIVGAFFADIIPRADGNHLTGAEIFVHPGSQGRGVGTKLSIAMFEAARTHFNVKVCDFNFTHEHARTRDWYVRLSMRVAEGITPLSGDLDEALIRLYRHHN